MILEVQPQRQLLDNWCWAAVTSTISFYYNSNEKGFLQSDLASRLIKDTCGSVNADNADSPPNGCDRPADITTALTLSGNFAGIKGRPLSMDEILGQINGGFPLCCQIHWPGLDGSHFVLLYGYEGTNLTIGDPDNHGGGVFSVPYSQLVSNYRGGGVWQRTIGTQSSNA